MFRRFVSRFGNPPILFLADRNILVDDPMAKDFLQFEDAPTTLSSLRAFQLPVREGRCHYEQHEHGINGIG
jgi:hypothetical protein